MSKLDNTMSNSAGSGSSRYRINNDGELINKTRTSSKREEAKQISIKTFYPCAAKRAADE